jgi:predicted NACHT family NTPase
MLEWLAATTGVELGKLVLEQVLDLGKPVLEGYVQDFFKDCLSSGVSRLNATALKTPMAEAVGYFIKRFIKELQINGVPETSIQHHYKAALKKFIQDKAVRPILGKAFEKNCKQIDYGQLEQIWTEQYQVSGWQFPSEEFDWRGVCKEYVYEVKGIVKANPELRSLLETDLLEDIARNTAQLSPGFDVETYRASLQSSYGYLKLYTLDSTDRVDAIKLWAMFIEQTVREALPPMRYDLPLDVKRQLQAEGQLEADLSPEALEHYRHEYFQQPARKILEAVGDSQWAVILGDPGSGKSSLLQYLALEWVEGKTEKLPLLIELREFAINPSANFLEFLHRGRGVDWQFDQQQLHQHLLESPTLVMFDGLDEVFDRATQSTVIDDIIRFSQQYPKAQVLVTSRIVGYNPDRLQHSGFRHFTIQSLDTDEIHEFIDRWYDLSMGSDPDKVRLKQRLKDAITNSKAIANLADNPLLLTMMAILNRRQELPRDRADLYDQASRVLLYHWDVDHKRLHIPMDAIGRREKQEILRLIAYEMQAGEEGLKGNLIGSDRLTRILTDYLRGQGFSEPREKANLLIQQLRERNFILCYRGADTYGFMHRTFLEYFCAVEIVYRFEKQRTLTFEQLRDEIFGQHWQDETWHEVLRLICGAIDPQQTKELIGYLSSLEVKDIEENTFSQQRIRNILLAVGCFTEIRNHVALTQTSEQLLKIVRVLVEDELIQRWYWEAIDELASVVAKAWGGDVVVLQWLQSCLESQENMAPYFAMSAIIQGWSNSLDILSMLKTYAQGNENLKGNRAAVQELIKNWRDDPDTLLILKNLAKQEGSGSAARQLALHELAENWKDDPETLIILEAVVHNENDYGATRSVAVEELVKGWTNKPDISLMLKILAQQDKSPLVRSAAVRSLAEFWKEDTEILELLCWTVEKDSFEREGRWQRNPRQTSLEALLSHYPTHTKTLELLRDRAINDPDEQLREWAQQQLRIHNAKAKMEASSNG